MVFRQWLNIFLYVAYSVRHSSAAAVQIFYTFFTVYIVMHKAFSALKALSTLMLLVGWQEGHSACKKHEWWRTGVVIRLERGANDLHMVHLMPLPPHHLLLQ